MTNLFLKTATKLFFICFIALFAVTDYDLSAKRNNIETISKSEITSFGLKDNNIKNNNIDSLQNELNKVSKNIDILKNSIENQIENEKNK